MKTAKKRNILVCLLAFFMFCIIGAAFHAVTTRQASAEESYTLTFKDVGSKTDNFAIDASKASVQQGTLTASVEDGALKTEGYAAVSDRVFYNVGYSLVSGRDYTLTFDLKITPGAGTDKIAFQVKDYNNAAIILNVSAGSPNAWSADFAAYKTITHKFTADKNAGLELRPMQVSAGTATVYIKNITLTYAVDQTATIENGTAIGTLPEVPAKEGYKGYWAIDGEKITAETVYNYGADKTAVAEYNKLNKLTFVKSESKPSKNYSEYFSVPADANGVPEGDGTCVSSDNNGIAISMSKGKALIDIGYELNLTEGVKYKTTFKFRLQGTNGEYFAVHMYALHSKPQMIKDWMSTNAYVSETIIENTFTYAPNDPSLYENGRFALQATWASGSGTVYISDIVVREESTAMIEDGAAIGTLPDIAERTHYTGNWTIDGTAISSETPYNYGGDKTAALTYTPVTYTLTFNDIDGNLVGNAEYTVESDKTALSIPAVPQLEGKDGAKLDGEWSGWNEFDLTQGGNMTFAAAYPDVKINVTFEDPKGENKTVEYAYGAVIGELPLLNAVGYDGVWKRGDTPISADYVIRDTESFTVTAVYTAIEYTLTFKILGETENLGTVKYTVETDPDTIVYPVIPERDGSNDGVWEEVNLKNGGDITVYFTYADRVTVVFKDEAGTVTGTVKVTVGKTIGALPELPAKKGYTGEWKSGDTVITADTVVTEDMTVTAVYTKTSGCGATVDEKVIALNVVALAVCAGIVVRKKKLQK